VFAPSRPPTDPLGPGVHAQHVRLVDVGLGAVEGGGDTRPIVVADEDFLVMTPLIHRHVNPHGIIELDMRNRLRLMRRWSFW